MRKLLGYIPLDAGEDFQAVAKETDVTKIEDQWFKLVEVWIPGTAVIPNRKILIQPNEPEYKKFERSPGKHMESQFSPIASTQICVNCGRHKSLHTFFKICPKP